MTDPKRVRDVREVLDVLADISIAALAIACGCPPDRLDALWVELGRQPVPHGPAAAYATVVAAVAAVKYPDERDTR